MQIIKNFKLIDLQFIEFQLIILLDQNQFNKLNKSNIRNIINKKLKKKYDY